MKLVVNKNYILQLIYKDSPNDELGTYISQAKRQGCRM